MSTKIPCQWVGRCLLTGLVTAALASRCVLAQDSQGPVNSIYNFMFGAPAATAGTSSAAADRPASSLASDLSRPDPYSLSRNPVVLVSDQVASPPNQPAAPPEQQTPPPDQQKLGQAPEDYSHQFLRQESVLLKPGEWQLDAGINYTLFDHNYTNLSITQSGGQTITTAVDSRLTSRLLLVPLELRYGLFDRLQAVVDVPFGWSDMQNSFFGSDSFSNRVGIGDVTAGISWLVHKTDGHSDSPDVIATFAMTAPTANVSPLQGILVPPNTLLGQGFCFASWNVLFIHTLDPVIVFYGFGSRHAFTQEADGFNVRYGDQYIYRGGLGFAVNERCTLSAAVTGSYITQPELDGQQIQGLAQEPIALRLAATIARPRCKQYFDPFVEIGMTPDAPNARVGVTFTY